MSQEIVLFGFPLSVLIIGIVAVCRYEGLPSKWAPGLSLLLGIAGGEAAQAHIWQTHGHPDWVFGAIAGIALGLVASGLYSHTSVFVATGTIEKPDKPAASAPPEPPPAP